MNNRLDARQFEQALDKLFQFLQKKGISINEDVKNDITKKMTSELAGKFTQDDITDPNVQKKLMSAITSYVMGKNEEFENTVSSLKDEDTRNTLDPKIDLDKKLKLEMTLMIALTKALDQTKQAKPGLTPDAFKKKVLDATLEKSKRDGKEKSPEEMRMIDQQLEATLRNLFGGNNPTINGEIDFPILGPVFGNLCGLTNQSSPDPKSLALMVEEITYNAGKVDYMGLENLTKLEAMSTGPAPEDLAPGRSPTLTMNK